MYKLVYNTFENPMQLQHALETIEERGFGKEMVSLAVSVEAAELLGGKLVEPEAPPEPKEGEEPQPTPPPAPAFDELSLKLWQKQKNLYRTFIVGEKIEGSDDIDRDLFNAYGTYLANNRIVVIINEDLK